MGPIQSTQTWQQQFQLLFRTKNILLQKLRHRQTSQKYDMLSLPISSPDQQQQLMQRLQKRQSVKSSFIIPLAACFHTKDDGYCGSKQKYDLIYRQASASLDNYLSYRKVKQEKFANEEICYVIRNVAMGLKDFKEMGEEYGEVTLGNIVVNGDVMLRDKIMIQNLEREQKRRTDSLMGNGNQVSRIKGFPSPQKLYTYFDTLTHFEQFSNDLYSLGIVALQMYHSQVNMNSLYVASHPRYQNPKINTQLLNQLVAAIREQPLGEFVRILTNEETQPRLKIYQLLKNYRPDQPKVKLLRENPFQIHHVKGEIQQVNSGERVNVQMAPSRVEMNGNSRYGYQYSANNGVNRSYSQVHMASVPRVESNSLGLSREIEKVTSTTAYQFNPTSTFQYNPASTSTYNSSFAFNGTTPAYTSTYTPAPTSTYTTTSTYTPAPSSTYTPAPFSAYTPTPPSTYTFQKYDFNQQYPKPSLNLDKIQSKYLTAITPTYEPTSTSYKQQIYNYDTSPITNSASIFSKFQHILKQPSISIKNEASPHTHITTTTTTTTYNNKPQVITSSKPVQIEPVNTLLEMMKSQSIYHEESKPSNFELNQKMAEVIHQSDHKNNEVVALLVQGIEQSSKNQSQSASLNERALSSTSKIQVVKQHSQRDAHEVHEGQQSEESEYVVEQYQIGTKYQGSKKGGKRNGRGKFFYKQGSYYDGEWKDNRMDGFGVLYYPNGSIAYEGEWKNDQFHGKGVVFNDRPAALATTFDYTNFNRLDQEWVKYEGELQNDAKEGVGRLTLTNGEIYEGEFYRDMIHGEGVFTKVNGSTIRGVWNESLLKKIYN